MLSKLINWLQALNIGGFSYMMDYISHDRIIDLDRFSLKEDLFGQLCVNLEAISRCHVMLLNKVLSQPSPNAMALQDACAVDSCQKMGQNTDIPQCHRTSSSEDEANVYLSDPIFFQ